MKRSTVVRHLTEIAEAADRLADASTMFETSPLQEMWIAGDVLDSVDQPEDNTVVLMIDVPVDSMPVLSIHPHGQFWAWHLDLSKRPLLTRYEPTARPAWNHERRRVLRFWSADEGLDRAAVDCIRSGPGDRPAVAVVQPTADDLRAYLEAELPRSSDHLRLTLDDYWDGPWRKAHTAKADWIYPDDHLWRAAYAVQSMQDALASLDE